MEHPTLFHRCWAEIESAALVHNLRVARRLAGRRVQVMGVVKANAYGHGLVPVAKVLAQAGIDALGVAQVAEGWSLREAGIRIPILVLSPTLPEEYAEAVRNELALTISSEAEGKQLNRVAQRLRRRAQIHFNVDTGMGRIGAWHEDAAPIWTALQRCPHVRLEGICSHFASADENEALTKRQWQAFRPFLQIPGIFHHIANSSGVMRQAGYAADLVRCGLMLYGISPLTDQPQLLQPALQWKSRITLLRRVPAGRTVSYGATYRLPQAQRLATVAVGYGDGYFRALARRGEVLVGGKRCPIRGRVTMDQIVVDVSRVPKAAVGNEVVLLGRQGREMIDAAELAQKAGTISYEILTNVGARVARLYRGCKQ